MKCETSKSANGRWHGILLALGFNARFLTKRNGPCPFCGGKDRWRWTDHGHDGLGICNQCGAEDGIGLLMKANGWDFREAVAQVDRVIGAVPLDQGRSEQTDEEKREALRRLWRASDPIRPDCPAGKYLYARCGLTEFPSCLRSGRDSPMLLAAVSAPNGKPATIHRTYLTAQGCQSNIDKPKKLMPGSVPRGAAIRLAPYADELGIAEGIETALSATAMFGVPCWALIAEGYMRTWQIPIDLKRLIVFGDNDKNFVGQAAAYEIARRVKTERATAHIEVEVRIPDVPGKDWNNIHGRMA